MRALLSVYDKIGLIPFATGLADLGFELVASGGTSKALSEVGIAHKQVEEITGAPEMLDGRVKTLHPAIHGGILADLNKDNHVADIQSQHIEPIAIVVCNLYPFTSKPSIEMIDVGGPTMVRAAAKNHAHVAIVVDPADYDAVLNELRSNENAVTQTTRVQLARKAFEHTATYDAAIVRWFDTQNGGNDHAKTQQQTSASDPPESINLVLHRGEVLRYGENPHQQGARYREEGQSSWWDSVKQHSGIALSYLNIFDADAAWRLAHDMSDQPAVAIIKHANPCGAAVDEDIATAYKKAFECDPVSAFGGIVAINKPVDEAFAKEIVANPKADVLIAPGFDQGALGLFASSRKNMRVLEAAPPGPRLYEMRRIDGGFLVQNPDTINMSRADWKVVTDVVPQDSQWRDVELAWKLCAAVVSNAIVYVNDGQAVGIGAGQQNRLESAAIAARKAGEKAQGGVCASDAFFPFRDGLDAVIDAGITCVIQPGGSMRDQEVIDAANQRGIAMIFTGERHFRH